MSQFRDLSPAHELTALADVPVVHVAWLESDSDIARGTVDSDFASRLRSLCCDPWQPIVLTNGLPHWCGFCRKAGIDRSAEQASLRNLFVPSAACVFFAPEAVIHYIETHDYCPPRAFQDAVNQCPPIGCRAYLDALAVHNWPKDDRFTRGHAIFVLKEAQPTDIAGILTDFGAAVNRDGVWVYETNIGSHIYIDEHAGLMAEDLMMEFETLHLYYRPLAHVLGSDGECRLFADSADEVQGRVLRELASVLFTTFSGLVEFRHDNGLAWIWTDSEVRAGALRRADVS